MNIKVGDKVKVFRSYEDAQNIGLIGTVVHVGTYIASVDFSESGWDDGHDCEGRAEQTTSGWNYTLSDIDYYLELYEKKVDQLEFEF